MGAYHLLSNHYPLVDGNKRTGVTATGLLLQINGYSLSASNQEVESFVLSIASGQQTHDSITEWLKLHTISR